MAEWNDEDESVSINSLPDELLLFIFRHLPLETVLACENVCQRWHKLSQDPVIWKQFTVVFCGKTATKQISEKSLHIIETHSSCIRHLKLQYVYIYKFIKDLLKSCDNLLSLELVMCRITDQLDRDIKKHSNLKKLNLKNSLLLGSSLDLSLEYAQLNNLTYLQLADFGMTYNTGKTLLNCKYLTHIFLDKVKDLNHEYVTKLIVSKQQILIALHIYGANSVDDKSLHLLSKCPCLKDLAIIRCENFTDKGLVTLANLKSIEHLQIWNNERFSELRLLHTLESSNLITLHTLSFSRIKNISPVIVDVISENYKQLKFLALYQCPKIIQTDYEHQLKSKFRNIDVVLY